MRSPFMFLVLLTGCPGGDDGGKPDDTGGGDTDTPPISGCITVDGAGGFGLINDAIAAANEGSVIDICDGTYEEAVEIDKAVTLQGASTDGVLIVGPGSDIPLTINAIGVTVSTLTVSSARTGIELEDAEAELTDVTVAVAGSWGMSAKDSTVTATGMSFVAPAAGGVEAQGGDVTIAESMFNAANGYGVSASDGANVTLTGNVFEGTVALGDGDGYDVYAVESTVTTDGNTFTAPEVAGIIVEDTLLTMTGDTISDTLYGVVAAGGGVDATGLTITGAAYLGFEGIDATETVSLAESTISIDVGASLDLTYDEFGDYLLGGGVLLASPDMVLTGVDVSGYENFGIFLLSYDGDTETAAISDVTIDNAGRFGAYLSTLTGTVSGLTVTNTRDPEQADPCAGYINQSSGVLFEVTEMTVDNLNVATGVGWGASNVFSDNTFANSTFDGNACYGFVNYQSAASIDGSTFTNGSDNGGIYDSEGVLTVTNSHFVDNHAGSSYEYDYGDYIARYEYSGGQGRDILAFNSSSLVFTGNTFEEGDSSIYASEPAILQVTGNSWTGYEGSLLYVYHPSETDPVVFSDNTADDVVGPVVQASYGEVEVENVTVGTTRISDEITVSSYTDDVLDYEYTYSSSAYVFSVSGYYYDSGTDVTDWPGAMSITDVTVDSAYSSVLYSYDGRLEVDNLDVGSAGGSLVYGYWYNYAPDMELDGITAGDVVGSGLYLYATTADTGGSVELSNSTFSSLAGYGVYAIGVGELTLSDVDLGSVTSDGVYSQAYTYAYDSTAGTYLNIDTQTAVSIDGLTMGPVGGDGVSLEGGSGMVTGLQVSNASGDGVQAEGLTTFALADSTITGPGGFGVQSSDTYYYSGAGGTETIDADTSASVSGVTVTGAGSAGFSFSGGTVSMTSASGSGSTMSGLVLSDITADIQGNSFTSNTEYGMTCSTVTLSACATNDLTSNLLGTHLDCSDSCGE